MKLLHVHHNLALLKDTQRALLISFARQYSSEAGSIKELSATASLLRNIKTGAEVYLIGTAHVSSKSATEVREMIQLIRPDTVVLELCQTRLQRLKSSQESPSFVGAILSQLGMPGNMHGRFVGAGLSGIYGVLKAFGLDPGAELKAGMEEAEKAGARVVCGDQDQQVTVQRVSRHLKWQDIMKLLSGPQLPPELMKTMGQFTGGLEDTVEALKNRESARKMSKYLRSVNPDLAKALIDERDTVLARAMLRLQGRAVGVVGLAHMDGIERIWKEQMGSMSDVVQGGISA